MFGHFIDVDGVFVAGVVVDGVAVLAVSVAAVLDAAVVVAACAITKLPTPVPASKPTESSAVAAILRRPVRRLTGSSGGGGGGMNWSPSMVLYLLGGLTFDVVQRRACPSERRGRVLGDCSEL
jgi:hypothetical protein